MLTRRVCVFVICRMRMYVVALIFYISLFCDVEARAKKTKSVTTLLEAKWDVTPLVLEVAEYLADENVDFYWSFIDSISSLRPSLVEIGMRRMCFCFNSFVLFVT